MRGWWTRWRRGARADQDPVLTALRAEVRRAAADAGDPDLLADLRRRLAGCAAAGADVEVEEELLDGALALMDLRARTLADGLPVVAHQHKALGSDACHLAVPATLLDDGPGRSGRLFATSTRLVFLATPLLALPWGAVRRLECDERDLLVTAPGRGGLLRFRCNTYGDARSLQFVGWSAAASARDRSTTAVDGHPDS